MAPKGRQKKHQNGDKQKLLIDLADIRHCPLENAHLYLPCGSVPRMNVPQSTYREDGALFIRTFSHRDSKTRPPAQYSGHQPQRAQIPPGFGHAISGSVPPLVVRPSVAAFHSVPLRAILLSLSPYHLPPHSTATVPFSPAPAGCRPARSDPSAPFL